MNVLILTASPRKKGNTNELVKAFCGQLDEMFCGNPDLEHGAQTGNARYEIVNLYDCQIEPCLACRHCQRDWDNPNCIRQDDLSRELFSKILQADLILLATPIYSWYCTAPAKALLDRCVYALNKYYGTPAEDGKGHKRGPSIWAGRSLALIVTCGYDPSKGADLLEEGIKRYCKHSGLNYKGMLCERHAGYDVPFMDHEKAEHAKAFARELMEGL